MPSLRIKEPFFHKDSHHQKGHPEKLSDVYSHILYMPCSVCFYGIHKSRLDLCNPTRYCQTFRDLRPTENLILFSHGLLLPKIRKSRPVSSEPQQVRRWLFCRWSWLSRWNHASWEKIYELQHPWDGSWLSQIWFWLPCPYRWHTRRYGHRSLACPCLNPSRMRPTL